MLIIKTIFFITISRILAKKTCAELITNKENKVEAQAFTTLATGLYSTVEAVAGKYIDFYNIQFYNQMATDFSTAEQLFNNSQPPNQWAKNPYNSLCELMRLCWVPIDKIVVGRCSCDGCGNTEESLRVCRGEAPTQSYKVYLSPEEMSAMFAEAELQEHVGGIMVWKVVDGGAENNGLDFGLPIRENRNKSGFFTELTGNPKPTTDLPRFVVYVNLFAQNVDPALVASWESLFAATSRAGANYVNLAFRTRNDNRDAALFWSQLSDEQRTGLRAQFPGMRLILSFGGDGVSGASLFTESEEATDELMQQLVDEARSLLYDGLDFDVENFTAIDKEKGICWLSYASWKVKQLWPQGIVTHAPQAPHFGPLAETVTAEDVRAIEEEFAQGHWQECYRHIRLDGTPAIPYTLPVPSSADFARPVYEGTSPLAASSFDLISDDGIIDQTTDQTNSATQTDQQTIDTTQTSSAATESDDKFQCSCHCKCRQ